MVRRMDLLGGMLSLTAAESCFKGRGMGAVDGAFLVTTTLFLSMLTCVSGDYMALAKA